MTNRLTMIGTCITLARRPEYAALWQTQPPAEPTAFATDLAALETERTATLGIVARADAATTGPASEKDRAETALEDAAFAVARAAANHLKKTGDLTRRATVDFTKNALQKLRDQALLTTTRAIQETATAVQGEPGAASRGLTPAALAALDRAATTFAGLLNEPRGTIAQRGALRREVETRVAGLMDDIEDLDDLVVQFAGTGPAGETGGRFADAWKKARVIVDAGHGPREDAPAPPAPPA